MITKLKDNVLHLCYNSCEQWCQTHHCNDHFEVKNHSWLIGDVIDETEECMPSTSSQLCSFSDFSNVK